MSTEELRLRCLDLAQAAERDKPSVAGYGQSIPAVMYEQTKSSTAAVLERANAYAAFVLGTGKGRP